MKRLLLVAVFASGMVLVGAGPASADAPPNANNCLGGLVSSLVPDPSFFGPTVSGLAQDQLADNAATGDILIAGANCGNNNSNNP